MTNTDLKKGSAELLLLSLLESEARHGYDLCRLIERRSKEAVRFNAASLYPLLYRMERKGFLEGRWVEKAGQRRRRYYRLSTAGRAALKERRATFAEFVKAVGRISGTEYA
jgi:transcriptional regulator